MVNPKVFSNIGDNYIPFGPFTVFTLSSPQKRYGKRILPCTKSFQDSSQGGDFTNHNGKSVYVEKFENKNYTMKYCCP